MPGFLSEARRIFNRKRFSAKCGGLENVEPLILTNPALITSNNKERAE